jgi:ADP-ribose pyrophosphatase
MGFEEKCVSKNTVYNGIIVNVRLDKAELVNGKQVPREVVEHPGGVGIVPVDDEGNIIVVRQFRYPFGRELLEIPAGKMERGEEPLDCAVRELSEETGFTADQMIYLGASYPSPGFCEETLHIYLARGLHSGKMHLDDDEFLNVEKMSLDTLCDMIMKNEIADGKTIIGALKAKLYLQGEDTCGK